MSDSIDRADDADDVVLARLTATLDELGALLHRVGERRWATTIDRSRAWIAAGDAYGIDALLGTFGGAGSINDLVLHEANGHDGSDVDLDAADLRLRQLLGDSYHDARELQRSLRRSDGA